MQLIYDRDKTTEKVKTFKQIKGEMSNKNMIIYSNKCWKMRNNKESKI